MVHVSTPCFSYLPSAYCNPCVRPSDKDAQSALTLVLGEVAHHGCLQARCLLAFRCYMVVYCLLGITSLDVCLLVHCQRQVAFAAVTATQAAASFSVALC